MPTGVMAEEKGGVKPGRVVMVWGTGPVSPFTLASVEGLEADRVIVNDHVQRRLKLVKGNDQNQAIDLEGQAVHFVGKQMTGGRGPVTCNYAVGMEAHVAGLPGFINRADQAVKEENVQTTPPGQSIQVNRKGGAVSLAGASGGLLWSGSIRSSYCQT